MANDQKLTDTYTNPQPESEPENLQTKYYNEDPNIFALVGIITTKNSEYFYNFKPNINISINEDGSICVDKNANQRQIRIEFGNYSVPKFIRNFEQKGTSFILYVRGYLYPNSRQSTFYPYQISFEDFQCNRYALPAIDELTDMQKVRIIQMMRSANDNYYYSHDEDDPTSDSISNALKKAEDDLHSNYLTEKNNYEALKSNYKALENKKKILEDGEEILEKLKSGKLILDRIDELEELANNYYIADILSKRIIEVREINKSDEEDHKYSQPPTTEIGLTSFGGNEKQLVCDILNKLNSYRRYANGKFNVVNDRVKLDNENENAYFMLNVLICIAQNFITVFAGQPGTGKTSLCDIIAGTLGLDKLRYDALDISRYISVSVERGWNSKSELIGYYNALSKKYEDSGSGLYHAMKLLNNEEASEAYPFFVLLDEANLSPVEHYWSAFMKLADESELHKDYRGEIAIGGGEKLRVPNQLRFLATINNDLTTEPLSPRLLDRTSVIKLPETANKPNPNAGYAPYYISWNRFKYLFSPVNDTEIDDGIVIVKKENDQSDGNNGNINKVSEIMNIIYGMFKAANISISKRVKNRIARYINSACFLDMPPEKAINYAVAQNLLPKINGFYEDFKISGENNTDSKHLFTELQGLLGNIKNAIKNNQQISLDKYKEDYLKENVAKQNATEEAFEAFKKAEENNDYISYLSL